MPDTNLIIRIALEGDMEDWKAFLYAIEVGIKAATGNKKTVETLKGLQTHLCNRLNLPQQK